MVHGNFRANNSEAVRDAALDGIGIALLPTFAVWHEVESGRLIRLLPDWTARGTFGDTVTAYFIADRHLTPKIRSLIDFLTRRFSRKPAWDSFSPPGVKTDDVEGRNPGIEIFSDAVNFATLNGSRP